MDSQKSGQNCNSPPLASSSQSSAGCGCPGDITLNITPTTGGSWLVKVDSQISIDTFKKLVAKRLRVNKERICLLYRDRQLRDGSLADNGLVDGSRLTLLPSVETGLLTQRPEISVMQALEALNDSQVNDFLSGKSPLNLTMRLGDHMMLIQLQLSTVTSMVPASSLNRAKFPVITTTNPVQAYTFNNNLNDITTDATSQTTSQSLATKPSVSQSNRQVLLSSLASALAVAKEEAAKASQTQEESSIKSLSDLATRPTVPVPTAARIPQSRSPHSSSTLDPIAAGLTSCLCTSLSPPCSCTSNEVAPNPDEPTRLTPARHDRPNSPILDTKALAQASKNLTQTLRQLSTEVLCSRRTAAANNEPEDARAQGAIIESMQHHGRGVYSGTFSGTLNPALQDSRGRPRRDISTIVHILNDLLCAAPPPRRESTKTETHREPEAIDPVLAKMVKAAKDSVGLEEEPMETPKSPAAPCDCTKCNNQCEASTSTASTSSSTETEVIEIVEELPMETQEEQNIRTRDKIEQLRLVMGQRRERRRLRKQKIQPYTIPNENSTKAADAVSAKSHLNPNRV